MSQKYYNNEIITNLIRKPNHIRGIAKDLNTNQTTIARKTNELHKQNIIDYRIQGKNKIFFLKDNIEARQSICITELQKLTDLIKRYPILRKISEKIRQNNKIHLAVLFGSYAKGLAKKDSDIDIYIETTEKKLKEEIEGINSRISVKIGRYDKDSPLIKEIAKNHVVIKGVEDYYEKNKVPWKA